MGAIKIHGAADWTVLWPIAASFLGCRMMTLKNALSSSGIHCLAQSTSSNCAFNGYL